MGPKGIVLAAVAVIAAPAFAQAPHIQAVVSAADFKAGVALGGIGTVFGTALSDKQYQFSALPFPTKLGPTDVFVCLAGKITQFNFLAFDTLAKNLGGRSLSLVVRVNGVIDDGATSGSSAGTQLEVSEGSQGSRLPNSGIQNPQPRIFTEGYDCFIDTRFDDANKNCGLTFTPAKTYQADRGAVTDQQGRLLSSANPARIGQYYTIWPGEQAVSRGASRARVNLAK